MRAMLGMQSLSSLNASRFVVLVSVREKVEEIGRKILRKTVRENVKNIVTVSWFS